MSVEVIGSDEFLDWYVRLEDRHRERVQQSVDLLEQTGVTLSHPHSSAILGSKIPLRELRIQSHGHAIRVFYVFDPTRSAILLIGGDKTGESNARFYAAYVPIAERIYAEYLAEQPKRSDRS